MIKTTKIINHKGLVRDMESKAVLNIDHQAKNEHRKKKEFMKGLMNGSNKIEELEKDINEIKNDISEIKKMFIQLTTK